MLDDIPNEVENDKYEEMKEVLSKLSNWTKSKGFGENENKIIVTIMSLVFMKKYMLEEFKTWELIYEKGLKWLKSINPQIKWDDIIKILC